MKRHVLLIAAGSALAGLMLAGCQSTNSAPSKTTAAPDSTNNQTAAASTTGKTKPVPKRYSYTPKPYPVDDRGFSPVDKSLAKAYAREDLVKDDEESSLNPYVLKVISGYPLDGSYTVSLRLVALGSNDILQRRDAVTQWFKGMVVAFMAYPDGSRCSYCCGFTFEVFVRAMKLRNIQKGLDEDDFNGMTFNDLFNALQLWYIEGKGDSEERAISSYGLGHSVTNLEEAKPGDFLSYSTTPPGGHSVIFLGWLRDENNKIIGFKYFSSNLSGTHGVGFGSSHFSDYNQNGHGVLRNSLHIGHVGGINDYVKFDRSIIPHRNAYAPTQPSRIIYVPAPGATTNASK